MAMMKKMKKMNACNACASFFEIYAFYGKEKTFMSRRMQKYFYSDAYYLSAYFCLIFSLFCAW